MVTPDKETLSVTATAIALLLVAAAAFYFDVFMWLALAAFKAAQAMEVWL